ncbi:uncharacterized protein LOC135930867 [Gordionus sp. m RMFG-2023]|uniref:uncharacterized protein LOC135930867 n=1 Tax=Gordionus sp. m RMFG-2023 TaxID=3053472 RepID=UPI0031FC96A4
MQKKKEENSQPENTCGYCGRTYARLSTLRTHLRTHSGDRPFKCHYCNKAFCQAANLVAHARIHSGEKPFQCIICRRTFSQSSSVTTHMRTHSGEKPYRCAMCTKSFSDSSTLTKHLRIHSGEKPYQCKLCLLRFSQSGNLNRHMRQKHSHSGHISSTLHTGIPPPLSYKPAMILNSYNHQIKISNGDLFLSRFEDIFKDTQISDIEKVGSFTRRLPDEVYIKLKSICSLTDFINPSILIEKLRLHPRKSISFNLLLFNAAVQGKNEKDDTTVKHVERQRGRKTEENKQLVRYGDQDERQNLLSNYVNRQRWTTRGHDFQRNNYQGNIYNPRYQGNNHNPRYLTPIITTMSEQTIQDLNTVNIEEIKEDDNDKLERKEYNLYNLDINNMDTDNNYTANDAYKVTVNLNDMPILMQIDTGSRYSILPIHIAKIGVKILNKSDIKLTGYDGNTINVLGTTKVKAKFEDKSQILTAYVVQSDKFALLGRTWITVFGNILDKFVNMVEDDFDNTIQELIKQCNFKLNKKPMLRSYVKLRLKHDATPKIIPPRRIPYSRIDLITKELQKWIKDKVIEPVEDVRWDSALTPVYKSDGSLRLCADFKNTINPALQDFKYPISRINDLMAKLSKGKKFTKIDFKKRVSPNTYTQRIKRFSYNNKGCYRFRRLTFGLKTSSAIFQQTMGNIFGDLKDVIFYIDDLLITVIKYGLTSNFDKSLFLQDKIRFLGHDIDKHVHINDDKIKAISNMPEPKTKDELTTFWRMASNYQKLCNFADIADPLYKKVNKDKWLWDSTHQESFSDLKKLISTSPTLNFYNPDLPIDVATDDSKKGLGAVLFHIEGDGKEKPIAFASRALFKSEFNYTYIEKEALSVIYSINKFQEYLIGTRFSIITDHKPLVYIFTKRLNDNSSISMRLQKWSLAMGAYDFTIIHRPGKRNIVPDCLSRLPQMNTEKMVQEIDDEIIDDKFWDLPINIKE